MNYDFSVIVLTYHPDKEKLMNTLRSIVMQRNIRAEVIIADDGSPDFFQSDIHEFMREHSFTDYRIVAHEENQGTVKNLLDGVAAAKGAYIKPISPGDYLYDADTLCRVFAFMQERSAKVTFGDMVYYSDEEDLKTFDVRNPGDDTPYLPDKPYSQRRVQKHMLAFADFLCGAALFFEKDALLYGLNKICGTVIYAEDAAVQLLALENTRIWKISGFVVWYEYGSGISTNAQLGFSKRIQDDFWRFYCWLRKEYADAPYVKRAYRKWKIMTQKGRGLNIAYRLITLDQNIFSIKRRRMLRQYRCQGYDTAFFNRISKP